MVVIIVQRILLTLIIVLIVPVMNFSKFTNQLLAAPAIVRIKHEHMLQNYFGMVAETGRNRYPFLFNELKSISNRPTFVKVSSSDHFIKNYPNCPYVTLL